MIFFYLAEVSKLTQFLADSMGLKHTLEKTGIWILNADWAVLELASVAWVK